MCTSEGHIIQHEVHLSFSSQMTISETSALRNLLASCVIQGKPALRIINEDS